MVLQILPLLILLLGVSCGGGKVDGPRKLEVTFGSLSTSGTPMLVFISNANGTIKHTRKVSDGKTSIVLANGLWNFSAIAWGSSSIDSFDGIPKCGFSQVNLVDSTSDITLKINPEDCTTSHFFGQYNWQGSPGQITFSGLRISFCPPSTTSANLTSNSYCTGTQGDFSFKIVLPEVSNNAVSGTGIESECYNPLTATDSYFVTGVKIPLGLTADSPFYTLVKTYPGSSDCSSAPQDIPFTNGLAQGSAKTKSFSPLLSPMKVLKIVQLPGKRATIEFAANDVPYAENVCRPFTVRLKDGDDRTIISPTDVNISVFCDGHCETFSDPACSVGASTTVFPGEAVSKIFYMKTSNVQSAVYVTPYADPSFTGAIESFRQRLNYSDISQALLQNYPDLSYISGTTLSNDPATVGTTYIYKTNEGRYGKMRVTARSAYTVVFDYETYGAFSGSNVTFSACSECSIDLDLAAPVFNYYDSNTEATFMAWGTDGSLMPYGNIQLFKVPGF